MRRLFVRLRARLRYRRFDGDGAEELRLHETMTEQDARGRGVSPDQAKWKRKESWAIGS